MPTQYVPVRIGNSSNFRVSIVTFPLSLQTIDQSPTSQLRSVPRCTRVKPVAIPSSLLLTKSYTTVMSFIALLLIPIRFVLMGTESVTTRGTLIGPLESTSSLFSFLSSRTDRTSVSSLESQLTGKWSICRSLRSLLCPGTLRTFECLDRTWNPLVLLTVYHPLDGMYGINRQHRCRLFPPFLTRDVLSPFILR